MAVLASSTKENRRLLAHVKCHGVEKNANWVRL